MRHPVLLPILLALAGCGGAHAATRDFPVGPFDRISNSTPFNVHVRVGGAPAVRAEGPDAALAHLQVAVAGGALAITSRPGSWWENGRGHLAIEVSAPRLVGAVVGGPGNMAVDAVRADRLALTVDGPGNLTVGRVAARELVVALHGPGNVTANGVEADRLDVAVDGPGGASLSGRAGQATLRLHGPGDVMAGGLALRDAAVTLDGPGGLVLRATGVVRGTVSGPGSLSVVGGARCEVAKHGPGDVNCR